jgi:hypothetical protein
MKSFRNIIASVGFLLMMFIITSLANGESYLYVEERTAVVESKMEAGVARGSLTRSEYSRLYPRLLVIKYKVSKYKKDGTTERQYLDLERELTGLEKDTERLLNSLKRR